MIYGGHAVWQTGGGIRVVIKSVAEKLLFVICQYFVFYQKFFTKKADNYEVGIVFSLYK